MRSDFRFFAVINDVNGAKKYLYQLSFIIIIKTKFPFSVFFVLFFRAIRFKYTTPLWLYTVAIAAKKYIVYKIIFCVFQYFFFCRSFSSSVRSNGSSVSPSSSSRALTVSFVFVILYSSSFDTSFHLFLYLYQMLEQCFQRFNH